MTILSSFILNVNPILSKDDGGVTISYDGNDTKNIDDTDDDDDDTGEDIDDDDAEDDDDDDDA